MWAKAIGSWFARIRALAAGGLPSGVAAHLSNSRAVLVLSYLPQLMPPPRELAEIKRQEVRLAHAEEIPLRACAHQYGGVRRRVCAL